MYGANEPGKKRNSVSQVRYVRITDIDEDGLLNKGLGATCEKSEKKYMLYDEDILIARSGNTVGKSYIHNTKEEPAECIFAGYMIKFVVNSNIVMPKYIFYYLQTKFFEEWKNATMRVVGQPNINAQEYKNMLIPIPPIPKQQQIIDIMTKAYSLKAEKEKQAEALLNSINDYLLQELGIVMPPEEENTLESRMFYVNSNKVLSDRFDPVVYSKKSEFYKNPTSTFKWIKFSDIIISTQTGLPVRQDFRAENGIYPYYGANGIIGYMDEYTHDGQYLVIGQDGYIGNHYIVNGKFWASNHNWAIKLNTNLCNYDYVKAFLDFWNYSHLVTGGVIPKLTQASVNKIPVVLPDLKVQDKIASEIKHIYAKAKKYEQEAKNAVDLAKAQVEKILLGGSL